MKILLLEDNSLQADSLAFHLKSTFGDAKIHVVRSESQFLDEFNDIVERLPDIFISDIMVRWAAPSPNIPPVPGKVQKEGQTYAGIRCIKRFLANQTTRRVPVILYSVLSRENYAKHLGEVPGNVICVDKSANFSHLSNIIHSLLESFSHPAADLQSTVFIVHGHDDEAKETVARFVEKLGLRAVILHEQPNLGRTIIEKLEAFSKVSYAVILLTLDDLGSAASSTGELRPRARQNVIFELGFFTAKLGRRSLCALYKPEVEIPSDFQGVLYVPMDAAGAWRSHLIREMEAAGLPVKGHEIR